MPRYHAATIETFDETHRVALRIFKEGKLEYL
jgi:hypothetical protein